MVRRSSFSRNSLSSSGAEAIRDLRDGTLGGYAFDDGVQYGLRSLAVGMSVEVENDAMAQYRRRYMQDVFHREVKAPAHQRQDAPALHQRLRPARRTAV